MDITEISRMLSNRAEEIARYLLPAGRREGQEWRCGSTEGDLGKSLAVHLSGAKAGIWADFASGERGGDLLDLWASVRRVPLADALRQVKDYLGIREPEFVGSRTKREFKKPRRPRCHNPQAESPVMRYLTEQRRLSESVIKAYRLAEGGTEDDPTILFPYLREGELVNVKELCIRRDEEGKKRTRLQGGCMLSLFGWQVISDNAREVVICEGEMDALSWYQYGFAALSVPNGAKSFTWLENDYLLLERFEVIYLSWDMDADGRAGVAEAIDRLGRHRCRVVKLSHKDANECLQEGVSQVEMSSCLRSAETCDPQELKRASSFVDEVIEAFYPSSVEPGFLPPWPKLHTLLRFRPAEFSIWTGFSKHGKTMMLNQVILSAMDQGERACIASLEIKPKILLKRTTRQATGQRLPTVELIQMAHEWYDGKLWIFDLVGSAKVDRLFSVFEYARQRYGITQFVIDSLLRCGIAEDDYNGQKEIADRCAEFATAHDVHVHLVAHTRKRDNDKHVSGRLDVRGSGAITDLAHNIFVVWRNKEKEIELEALRASGGFISEELLSRPDAHFICDATREGEWDGRAGLWYDPDSQQYLEARGARPEIYVRLSDRFSPGSTAENVYGEEEEDSWVD